MVCFPFAERCGTTTFFAHRFLLSFSSCFLVRQLTPARIDNLLSDRGIKWDDIFLDPLPTHEVMLTTLSMEAYNDSRPQTKVKQGVPSPKAQWEVVYDI